MIAPTDTPDCFGVLSIECNPLPLTRRAHVTCSVGDIRPDSTTKAIGYFGNDCGVEIHLMRRHAGFNCNQGRNLPCCERPSNRLSAYASQAGVTPGQSFTKATEDR